MLQSMFCLNGVGDYPRKKEKKFRLFKIPNPGQGQFCFLNSPGCALKFYSNNSMLKFDYFSCLILEGIPAILLWEKTLKGTCILIQGLQPVLATIICGINPAAFLLIVSDNSSSPVSKTGRNVLFFFFQEQVFIKECPL